MRIAVTSQNLRTITAHAGKTRRFLILEVKESGECIGHQPLELPAGMALHDYHGDDHPLFQLGLDALITQSAGEGFRNRLACHGIAVHVTSATDPQQAAVDLAAGRPLPPPVQHEHPH